MLTAREKPSTFIDTSVQRMMEAPVFLEILRKGAFAKRRGISKYLGGVGPMGEIRIWRVGSIICA